MSTTMHVFMSQEKAPEVWGDKAFISFSEAGTTIHLNASTNSLIQVQKAARNLANQGLLNVTLSGEGWDLEHIGFSIKVTEIQKRVIL